MLGPAARVVVQTCTATSVSTAWAPRGAGTEPAGSLFFFFDPDNVRLAWFVPALGVSRLPYRLLCFGILAALPWGSSRSPAAFLTYSEIFYGFVPNLLSLENYQLALIHFLLSFTARRST